MRTRPLHTIHLLEDGAAHHGVSELERVLVAEEIGSNKRARRGHGRRSIDSCERCGERERRPIAQDRRRTQQIGGFGRKTRQARRHAVGHRRWAELEEAWRGFCGRRNPLPPDRVEQRDQVERVTA